MMVWQCDCLLRWFSSWHCQRWIPTWDGDWSFISSRRRPLWSNWTQAWWCKRTELDDQCRTSHFRACGRLEARAAVSNIKSGIRHRVFPIVIHLGGRKPQNTWHDISRRLTLWEPWAARDHRGRPMHVLVHVYRHNRGQTVAWIIAKYDGWELECSIFHFALIICLSKKMKPVENWGSCNWATLALQDIRWKYRMLRVLMTISLQNPMDTHYRCVVKFIRWRGSKWYIYGHDTKLKNIKNISKLD